MSLTFTQDELATAQEAAITRYYSGTLSASDLKVRGIDLTIPGLVELNGQYHQLQFAKDGAPDPTVMFVNRGIYLALDARGVSEANAGHDHAILRWWDSPILAELLGWKESGLTPLALLELDPDLALNIALHFVAKSVVPTTLPDFNHGCLDLAFFTPGRKGYPELNLQRLLNLAAWAEPVVPKLATLVKKTNGLLDSI